MRCLSAKSVVSFAFCLLACAPHEAGASGVGCVSSVVTQWVAGNGHYYQVVCAPTPYLTSTNGGIEWSAARKAAIDAGGYLATLTSSEENLFVAGLASNTAYWHVDPANHNLGPFFGLSALPAACGSHPYLWVTGETLSYSNWDGGGEPLCAGGTSYAAGFSTSIPPAVGSTWNDTSYNA